MTTIIVAGGRQETKRRGIALTVVELVEQLSNTEPGGETHANKVAHDLSFMSSGDPKIAVADRPSTRQHRLRRTPTSAARERGARGTRSASATLLIE